MLDILIKAIGFILIIVMGYVFKSKGIFQKEHARFLSFVIMNVTLPCALFTSVGHIEVSSSLLLALLIGFGSNIITIVVGYMMVKKESLMENLGIMNGRHLIGRQRDGIPTLCWRCLPVWKPLRLFQMNTFSI